MTIDEAIKHCEKVAEELEKKANIYEIKNTYLPDSQKPVDCLSCAADHRQLAERLRELKEAIRLLRLALNDIAWLSDHSVDEFGVCNIERDDCKECPLYCGENASVCGWRYQVDVLNILKEG